MATFNLLLLILLPMLLYLFAAAARTKFDRFDAPAPSFSPNEEETQKTGGSSHHKAVNGAPEPVPPDPKFLQECAKGMSPDCAEVVYKRVFEEAEATPASGQCCRNLVAMGKECHRGLAAAAEELSELAEVAAEGRKRVPLVWNECVRIARQTAATPAPL